MARGMRSKQSQYRELLHKCWFEGIDHPFVDGLVFEIDKSLEEGDLRKAVSLMKAVDVLGGPIPHEGLEMLDKDISQEEEDPDLDKGRQAALGGEVRSMDITGNETARGQRRRQVRKVEGGGWASEHKPAPHEGINPKDTYLGK